MTMNNTTKTVNANTEMSFEEFEKRVMEDTHNGNCDLCAYAQIEACHSQCERTEELYDEMKNKEVKMKICLMNLVTEYQIFRKGKQEYFLFRINGKNIFADTRGEVLHIRSFLSDERTQELYSWMQERGYYAVVASVCPDHIQEESGWSYCQLYLAVAVYQAHLRLQKEKLPALIQQRAELRERYAELIALHKSLKKVNAVAAGHIKLAADAICKDGLKVSEQIAEIEKEVM